MFLLFGWLAAALSGGAPSAGFRRGLFGMSGKSFKVVVRRNGVLVR